MTDALTIISKYLLTALMILYTAGAFAALGKKHVRSLTGWYYYLNTVTFLFHAAAFAVIYLNTREITVLIQYGMQLVFFLAYLFVYRTLYRKANPILLSHMLLFIMTGFVILTRLVPSRAQKQFAITCAAAAVTLIVPKMFAKIRAARVWAGVTGVIGLALLTVVWLKGRVTYGANLTLSFGSIVVQPSEFVKISFVLLISVLFRERTDVRRILLAGCITLAHVGVLVLSNDLGAAVIYAASFLMMLYVATGRVETLFVGVAGGAFGTYAAFRLFSHVQTRVLMWLNPWQDYEQRGYQIANSLFGIATGGWFGQGLYRGSPGKIPKYYSDFVFAAVCEELGGITGICIILICLACLLMFIRVASVLYLPFYRLTGVGLAVIYGVQVLLNIGGVIKFIPSTGVTLPFISYGVNSVISTFILFGIMQELYIKQQNEVDRIEETRERYKIPGKYRT